MLTVILCIGPLARLSPRFLLLLYNRRHFGVAMFAIAFAHAALATVWYHGFGDVNPLVSVLTSGAEYDSFAEFPFQPLGLAALLILFAMAATSHDWLANLGGHGSRCTCWCTSPTRLLVGHVAAGVLQVGPEPIATIGTATSLGLVGSTSPPGFASEVETIDHRPPPRMAGSRSATSTTSRRTRAASSSSRVVVESRSSGTRRFSAALQHLHFHRGGPLGEGRIVDGCLTCPWHGYQYIVTNGQSPAVHGEDPDLRAAGRGTDHLDQPGSPRARHVDRTGTIEDGTEAPDD